MKAIMWRLIIVCVLDLGMFGVTHAQNPISFSNLTIENGMSQNSVMAITQDRSKFMWLGTRQGLNRYDGHEFKIYRNDPANPESLSNNEIQCLLSDSKGTLWTGTVNGLNRYDQKKDAFVRIKIKGSRDNNNVETIYEDPNQNLWIGTVTGLNLLTNANKYALKTFLFDKDPKQPVNHIHCIFKDKHKNIWVGTEDGLICMTLKNGHYQYEKLKHDPKKRNTPASNYITAITADAQQNLWVGTDKGIYRYNYTDKIFKGYQHNDNDPNSIIHNDIREIRLDYKGLLWIGTQEGLSIYDPVNERFSNYQHDPEIGNTLSHNSIHSIFQDINNTMWLGTYFGGVNLIFPISTKFIVTRNSKLRPSISGNVISSIVEDKEHNLWIGTEGGGLNYLNRKSHTIRTYKTNPNDSLSITSNLVKFICKNKGTDELIVGTHKAGLNIFDPATGDFRHIINVKDPTNAPGSAEILALTQDDDGTVWVGSLDGLSVLKKENGLFPQRTTKSALDKYMNHKGILAIFKDQKKNMWFGTPAGLYYYNITTKHLRQFNKAEADSTKLYSDFINCITETSGGQILIGTYFGGLSIYDPQTNNFKTFTETNGLANNNVLGVEEDDSGKLWISTANGLSELDLQTKEFRNYTKSDGLAGNEFNSRSYFKDSQGKIFMGGINGLTSFYPKQIELNTYKAPLIFTELRLFNQPIGVNGPDGLLKEPMIRTPSLTFKHDQNHFTISFALLNYIKSDKNAYTFKLVGYDKDWIHSNIPSATYTNLPAGNYHFIVRGFNNDGVPGKDQAGIKIKILPPIWASWWAYALYLLVFSIILFLIIRYLFVKALLKRQEDVQQMKLNFFTYISHEIRTPLTLILGPLESLLKSTKDLPEINNQVLPIKNNADRLMRLISELMDFRKTETGNLKLNIKSYNIIEFTNEIFQSFLFLAKSGNIHYTFYHKTDHSELYFDKVQLEKVLFNLLSNAFKFTRDNGIIQISIDETSNDVLIKVRDNGDGIPFESQQKLFSEFFQVDTSGSHHIGSGIGLALSKSIVTMHHGNIAIKSLPATTEQTGDTCFTVTLKKGNTHFSSAELSGLLDDDIDNTIYLPSLPFVIPVTAENPGSRQRETILLVEDNPEIRHMLCNFIGKEYDVKESYDGSHGWETAIELLPDLIICDVMMPVMDGLELCRKLKTDERTSHIPIILLTAKSSHMHQIEGMETGADTYITKPFSIELLKLNVRNLLRSRANMRQRFSKEANLQLDNFTTSAIDQAFMINIIQYIEERIKDQDFGVPELAAHIGMSQPILYKKIRAITDLSVNDFIKSIRLKKAAQLLPLKIYNVSDVSYLVGFNDPKYFSREFRKQYGQTPKAYINSILISS
jgi:ligand-binding sensor domain-containing protein/signal transduction histidine kinase/DNA-binding response OmpR family regulator